jgi:hypothetical protein
MFVFLLSGCSVQEDIKFESYRDIELFSMKYPDLIGIPLEILKKDNYLIIADFRGDSLVSVFDIENNRIYKMASVGKGPGEVMPPVTMQLQDDKLLIHSRGNNIFYCTHLSEAGKNKTVLNKLFDAPSQTSRICMLTGQKYVSSGYFPNHRYALLDSTGSISRTFGEFPDFWHEEKHIPDDAKAMFHQSSLHKNPRRPLFATIASHVLEIWEYGEDTVQRVSRIQLGTYQYRHKTGNMVTVDRIRPTLRGVTSATCNGNYIYAVCHNEEEKSEIWIFDWTGKPVKCLRTDKDICTLCVDEEMQTAYCIVNNPDPVLMYFSIP